MSVRTAELLMALALAIFSLFLMWESAKLPIGWTEGRGPGGGAWPFWLAVIMLLSCMVTLVRWFKRATPESRSGAVFMSKACVKINGATVIALTLTLVAVPIIGMYFALMGFLLFYLQFIGQHRWYLAVAISILLPVFLFFFFEALLKIIMPKGYAEPLFIPLYRIIF